MAMTMVMRIEGSQARRMLPVLPWRWRIYPGFGFFIRSPYPGYTNNGVTCVRCDWTCRLCVIMASFVMKAPASVKGRHARQLPPYMK